MAELYEAIWNVYQEGSVDVVGALLKSKADVQRDVEDNSFHQSEVRKEEGMHPAQSTPSKWVSRGIKAGTTLLDNTG